MLRETLRGCPAHAAMHAKPALFAWKGAHWRSLAELFMHACMHGEQLYGFMLQHAVLAGSRVLQPLLAKGNRAAAGMCMRLDKRSCLLRRRSACCLRGRRWRTARAAGW
jgi:hypothetical protein